MKRNKILSASLALLLGWGGTAFAQSEVDALRYTRLGVAGSARIQGIGGAQTALGADISAMNTNPAGLGMFRRSEFSFSPAVQSASNDAFILGENTTGSKGSFNFPQFGVVLSNRKGDDDASDWRGTTFGISYTRLNNFNDRAVSYNTSTNINGDEYLQKHEEYLGKMSEWEEEMIEWEKNNFQGESPKMLRISDFDPTAIGYFADLAEYNARTQGSLEDEYDDGITTLEGLAYGGFLFNYNNAGYIVPELRNGVISQREEIKRRGSQNQFDIGVGTSYRDKLYLGASVGIVSINYKQENIYTEVEADPTTSFSSFEYRDEFKTEGTGINLRVGAIIRPIDALRFGISIQTPTAYTLNDEYQCSISTKLSSGPEFASEIPGQFTYHLKSPFKANGGMAVFAGKYGFLSADIEYLNYGSAKFTEDEENGTSSGNYFDEINQGIKSAGRSVWNYKVGAEGRYEIFRVRAGYAYNADPDNDNSYNAGVINYKFGAVQNYTFGLGLRLQNFYIDAAYAYAVQNVKYAPFPFVSDISYTPYIGKTPGEPEISIENKQNTVAVTLGFNF